MKRCAITGARGYLGSRLAASFRLRGWDVLELSRNVRNGDGAAQYSLTGEVPADALRGVDVLVHAAYDFTPRSATHARSVNLAGSMRLFSAAKAAEVRCIIFISSLAAFDGCQSVYGGTKLLIEREAAGCGAWIVRPGVIYGRQAGGLLGAMRRVVGKLPVVPVLGSGRYALSTAHEEDLCALILKLAETVEPAPPRPLIAAAKEQILFIDLLRDLASAAQKRPLFVPVPWRLAWLGLRCLESLGFSPGLRSDSVVSLVHGNPSPSISPDDHRGVEFRPFRVEDL